MKTVFIPNVPTRYDAATEGRVPSIDLNPATQFGSLVTMTKTDAPADQQVRDIKAEIDIRFQEGDYILCVGDVVLTAVAIAYVSKLFGAATVLRWNRRAKSYDVVMVSI